MCKCVCVSSGPPVGQHVSAPAASLSQAVISTYRSDRPAKEDTGTHNPHSGLPLLHLNVQHSSASPLFSFGLQLVRSCRANNRVSPASFSNCNKGVLRLLERRRDPGKATFQIAGYVGHQRQAAQCDTLKEVEKIKRSILASCEGILWSKTQTLGIGTWKQKKEQGMLECSKGMIKKQSVLLAHFKQRIFSPWRTWYFMPVATLLVQVYTELSQVRSPADAAHGVF